MMNPQKQITTNAPSIRYEGDLRAEQAGIMQKHAQAMQQMQQQNMMQQQQQQQGMMQPQMGQPQMPQDPRQMAAYGGIMGVDGRKQYGIGSWFQEKIMDPIKNNKALAAAAAIYGLDTFGGDKGILGGKLPGGGGNINEFIGKIFKGTEKQRTDKDGRKVFETDGVTPVMETVGGFGKDITAGLAKGLVPAAGGLVAGMFSDQLNPADEQGNIDYGSGIGLSNIGKSANLLTQQQGMDAGLRFLPKVSTREYTPEQMAETYTSKALQPIGLAGGGISQLGIPNYGQQMMDPNMMEQIKMMVESMQAQGMGKEEMEQAVRMQVPNMSADMSMGYAEGGPSGEMGTVMEEGEEMLDMNGMEKDYREEGGFVPIGEYEKKDDVPARLSVNEFVFTADAVRGAGDGDIDKGAERLQGIMKQLEQQGRPEGMGMLNVSERLSEVV
jgi:hypothetical protein